MAIGVAAQDSEFAEIHHSRFEAFVAQHVGDSVGDIALSDAVEGYGHAFARERDARSAGLDAAKIDQLARDVPGAGHDVLDDAHVRPEMSLIESPKRLHRYVECAAAHDAKALALLDERAQFRRGSPQYACGVEARDFAVQPVQAEYPLKARDLALYFQDSAARECRIGVDQRQLRKR